MAIESKHRNIVINHPQGDVTLGELHDDAMEAKKLYGNDFSFTCDAVLALINKITLLSDKIGMMS